MKNKIFSACAPLLLILSTTSALCQNTSNNLIHDGVFIVSARDGFSEVVKDKAEIFIIPSGDDTLTIDNVKALKKAWAKCYGALLLNKKDELSSVFIKGVPDVIQLIDGHEGKVRITTISRVKNTIRVLIRIEVYPAKGEVSTVQDGHKWTMNENGEWKVESILYQ